MRSTCVLGILIISVCVAQIPAPTPSETDAFDGDYLASLRVTQDVTALSPVQTPGPQGDPRPAGSVSVAQLRHRPPRKAQQLLTRGTDLSAAGDHQRAVKEFEKAVIADPELASAHRSLGEEYGLLGRYPEAIAELQRSLTLDSASWIGHYNLAAVLYVTGDLPGAERSVRRALELSKANAQVHALLGLLLWRQAETRPEALEHLRYAARGSAEAKELLMSLERE